MTTRAAIISSEWPPITGGVGTALKSMVECTAALRSEYDVDLVVVAPGQTRQGELVRLGPRAVLHLMGVGKGPTTGGWVAPKVRWMWALADLDFRADVYHYWYGIPSVWYAREPFILTLHGGDVPGRWPRYKYVWPIIGRSYRKHCLRAKAITAVTRKLCEMATPFFGRDVAWTPNGVKIPENVTRELHDPVRLLAVTRVEPLKNVEDLLQIAYHMPDAILRVVGDGSLMRYYRDNLSGNIEWVGWQNDLDEHYRWADVFVNTTSATGMSCTMLEAKAYRLPIVARVFPHWADAGGVFPAFVQERGVDDYLKAIRYVLADYPLATCQTLCGTAGLSWSVRARPYFELYEQIARGTL